MRKAWWGGKWSFDCLKELQFAPFNILYLRVTEYIMLSRQTSHHDNNSYNIEYIISIVTNFEDNTESTDNDYDKVNSNYNQ